MGTILKDAEGVFLFIGHLFIDIVNALWAADKQILQADLTNLLHAEGVAIQNATPGISTLALAQQLIAVGVPLLTGDLAALGHADVVVVAGVIAKDLKTLDGGGNAGVVTGSATEPAAPTA